MSKYANRLEKIKTKIEEIEKTIDENVAKKQRLEDQYEDLCRLTLADALGCDPNNINTIIMSDPAILEKLRPSNDHKAEVPKKVSANVSADEDDDEIVFYDTIVACRAKRKKLSCKMQIILPYVKKASQSKNL